MTDPERELTPEQEADVRRLLAEARVTEPLPADVAARLDRVLAGLGEEGFPAAPTRHVVAPPWRRRRATMLLVAAAAVVAIGVGLGQIDGLQGSSDDDGGGSADTSAQAERAPNPAAEDGGDSDGNVAPNEQPTTSDYVAAPAAGPVGRVREDRFTADVNQLRRAIPDDAVNGEFVQLTAGQLPPGYVLTGRAFDCAAARWGPGFLVPVFYDSTPAVLAYHPVTGESQIVELLRCGTGESVRSTTLPAG